MEICSRFTGMERKDGAFLLHTDNADIKVCFVRSVPCELCFFLHFIR